MQLATKTRLQRIVHQGPVLLKGIWLCALLLLCAFCITFFVSIVDTPVFFFSDQTWLINKYMGDYTSLFRLPAVQPSRFDVLGDIEFHWALTSGQPLHEAMRDVYYIQGSKFLVFCSLFFFSLCSLANLWIAILAFTFLLQTQNETLLLTTFGNTPFPDSAVCIFLSLFVFAYYWAQKKDSTVLFGISLLAAIIATYYKEPVFSIFVVFSCARWIVAQGNLSPKEKKFLFLLVMNGIAFVIAYFIFTYSPDSYAAGRTPTGRWDTFILIIKGSSVFGPALCIACARFYYALKRGFGALHLGDVLLSSALVYFFSYIVLNLYLQYYYLPSFILVFFAFALYAKDIYQRIVSYKTRSIRACAMLFFTFLLVYGVRSTYFQLKNFPIFTNKKEKIITQPYCEFLQQLLAKGHFAIAYYPDNNDYARPFQKVLSYWYNFVSKKLYRLYVDSAVDNAIPLEGNKDIFMDKLDAGAIGQVTPVVPITPYPWAGDSNYALLDMHFTNFVYNKAYAADIEAAFCDFAKKVRHLAPEDFIAFFPGITYKAGMLCQDPELKQLREIICKNITDLMSIRKALEKYHQEHGSYPMSSGFQGYSSAYGSSKGAVWIDGLVPDYIPELARDARDMHDGDREYLYISDGKDFKLIAHSPENIKLVEQEFPELLDPVRKSWAFGYWTDNARDW